MCRASPNVLWLIPLQVKTRERKLSGVGAHIPGQCTHHGNILNFPRVPHSSAGQVRPAGCGHFCKGRSWEGVDSVCRSGNVFGKCFSWQHSLMEPRTNLTIFLAHRLLDFHVGWMRIVSSHSRWESEPLNPSTPALSHGAEALPRVIPRPPRSAGALPSLCPAHSAPPAGAPRVGLPQVSAPPAWPAAPWVGSSSESLEGNLLKPGVSGRSSITFWLVCCVPGKGLTSHKSPQSLLRAGSIPNTLYTPSRGFLSNPWGGQGSEDWTPPWAHTSLRWRITSGSPLPHPSWQNLPSSRTHWIGPGKWNRGHEWGMVTKSRQRGPHHHLALSPSQSVSVERYYYFMLQKHEPQII